MKAAIALVLLAMAITLTHFSLNDALALGNFPKPPGGPGSTPTPGPIAGGGVLWLGIVAVAGIWMLIKRMRQ